MVFSMLVFVQCERIGGILIVIHTVLPLLPQLEIIVEVSFHHNNFFLGIQPRDFSLGADHQNLIK